MQKSNDEFFITDLYSHGQEHQLVVTSFIEMFNVHYPKSQFLLNSNYNGERTKNFIFDDSSIHNKIIKLINRDILKLFNFIIYLPKIFLSRKKVVFLGLSNIQYFIILLICRVLKIKCFIVQHSELEYLENPKTLSQKLFAFSIKYLKGKSSFLILSKHITPPLVLGDNFFKIDHPLPSQLKKFSNQDIINNTKKLAIVGLLSDSHKSCNKIYDLEKLITDDVSLYAIGRNKGDFIINRDSRIKFIIWDKQYSDDEFQNAIKDINCLLFFFSSNCYNKTASGTIMDAIIYGKNIIALDHPAINSAAYRYKGLYTFKSIDDISKFLKNNKLPKIDSTYLSDYIESRTLISIKNEDTNVIMKWLAN
ncbi:hypothetical protein ABJA24_003286 [Providencia rettgeri]